ncbi:MAG: hypothetical protein ABI435_01220 [Pseudolysinimonas sp.]
MTDDELTPADLERELGVDQKRIRRFLRKEYGKLNRSVNPHWHLTHVQADEVRQRFGRP